MHRFNTNSDLVIECLDEERGGFSHNRLKEATRWLEYVNKTISALAILLNKFPMNVGELKKNYNNDEIILKLDELKYFFSSQINDLEFKTLDSFLDFIYPHLSMQDLKKLIEFGIKLLYEDPSLSHYGLDMILSIFRYDCHILADYHMQLIQYPLDEFMIFWNANVECRNQIFELLHADAKPLPNYYYLSYLFAIADKKVCNFIFEWLKDPLILEDEINDIVYHLLSAGWFLTENADKQNLYFENCVDLIIASPNESPNTKSIIINSNSNEYCGWCHQNLINLITIDLSDPSYSFISLNGNTMKIQTCKYCFSKRVIFIDFDKNGKSVWSAFNMPELNTEVEDLELIWHEKRLIPLKMNHPFVFYAKEHSQLGGFPTWIQQPDYPSCPACHNYMRFIAQITGELIFEDEGMFYCFICLHCQIVASLFQRT